MKTKTATKPIEAETPAKVTEGVEPQDYLMWVGSVYYPTVDSYISEAKRLGPCKRLGRLPLGLVPGKSRVFLAHDDGINGEGFIFGYFIPNAIQYLARSEDDIPDNLYTRVTPVTSWVGEEERECGLRFTGMYVVGETRSKNPGVFVVFDQPRKLNFFDAGRKHFRGMLQVPYAKGLLAERQPKQALMTPPSRIAHKKVDPSKPWTEKELGMIEDMIGNQGFSQSKTAQLLSYKLGRTKYACASKIRSLMDGDLGDGDSEE